MSIYNSLCVMDWKKTLNLIVTIIGICIAFYYGFRHYVMDEDHHEWEEQGSGEKMVFYLVTSPIWIIAGIIAFFEWIFSKNSFSMTIEDIFDIPGKGPVVTGTIEKGRILSGDKLEIIGQGKTLKVVCFGIEHHRQRVTEAKEGENIGILLKGVRIEDLHKGQKVIK